MLLKSLFRKPKHSFNAISRLDPWETGNAVLHINNTTNSGENFIRQCRPDNIPGHHDHNLPIAAQGMLPHMTRNTLIG